MAELNNDGSSCCSWKKMFSLVTKKCIKEDIMRKYANKKWEKRIYNFRKNRKKKNVDCWVSGILPLRSKASIIGIIMIVRKQWIGKRCCCWIIIRFDLGEADWLIIRGKLDIARKKNISLSNIINKIIWGGGREEGGNEHAWKRREGQGLSSWRRSKNRKRFLWDCSSCWSSGFFPFVLGYIESWSWYWCMCVCVCVCSQGFLSWSLSCCWW